MDQITIICSDPVVEKLLRYISAELPGPGEQVVLLDAAMMERIREFSGAKVILFTASADPELLEAVRKTEAAGFWYLQPSAEDLARVLAGEPASRIVHRSWRWGIPSVLL